MRLEGHNPKVLAASALCQAYKANYDQPSINWGSQIAYQWRYESLEGERGEGEMPITFADQTNTAINTLVGLCSASNALCFNERLVALPLHELAQGEHEHEEEYPEEQDAPSIVHPPIRAYPFTFAKRVIKDMVIAVDCGIKNLGRLSDGGTVFAIRGAAVCYARQILLILRYKTGVLLITPQNKARVFRYIGERLGTPDLYVIETGGTLVPKPSAIDTANQVQDRCRSFVERMIQEEALGILAANKGGILLIDGTLASSYDTPQGYLSQMLAAARDNGIDICAISKRSRIAIGNVPIDALFDPYPTFVGYAPLLEALRQERQAYEHLRLRPINSLTAGTQIFAARFGFGPPGVTFRVDVSKSWGATDSDVINDVYNRCRIYGGYPKPLVDAHHYSVFLGSDALTLLADLVARTGIRVKEEPSLEILFQPFGAFGK